MRLVACWTGELVRVFDGALGYAGEEGLFGCEFSFGLGFSSSVLVETWIGLGAWRWHGRRR